MLLFTEQCSVWSISCCVIFTQRHNLFLGKTDFGRNMVEDTQSEFKALPHDIVEVSIEKYLEDSDINFKVIDVRTADEYCENR